MNLPSRVEDSQNLSFNNFPPRLRKIAKFIFNSNQIVTVEDAISELKLNRKSIYNGISDSKKKGNDFYEFLNQSFQTMLSRSKFDVGQAMVRRAVSGSHNHQKLYYQLTGDLKETTNLSINHLTIGVNIQGVQVQDDREKGVIDVEPVIPKK